MLIHTFESILQRDVSLQIKKSSILGLSIQKKKMFERSRHGKMCPHRCSGFNTARRKYKPPTVIALCFDVTNGHMESFFYEEPMPQIDVKRERHRQTETKTQTDRDTDTHRGVIFRS